jgi:hypothetical protein
VSLGFEEVEEDEDGDCSKNIILEMGSIICMQTFNFLILNFLKFLIEYILYSYIEHV